MRLEQGLGTSGERKIRLLVILCIATSDAAMQYN
jgi:hypothetical protein